MIFFKRMLPKTKKMPLTDLEKEVIGFLIGSLDEPYKSKLKDQIPYLPRRKRITYPKSVMTEFYPDKGNTLPAELLFSRDEEFSLGSVKFKINGYRFYAKFHMVLGSFFDINIRPRPPKKVDIDRIEFLGAKIEENLDKNIY